MIFMSIYLIALERGLSRKAVLLVNLSGWIEQLPVVCPIG